MKVPKLNKQFISGLFLIKEVQSRQEFALPSESWWTNESSPPVQKYAIYVYFNSSQFINVTPESINLVGKVCFPIAHIVMFSFYLRGTEMLFISSPFA